MKLLIDTQILIWYQLDLRHCVSLVVGFAGVAFFLLLGFSRKHQLPKQVFGDMAHMLIAMNQACAAFTGSGGNQ